MLPFLKNKEKSSQPGVIIKTRAPDEFDTEDQNDPDAAIEACAQDLINAIHAKDAKSVAQVIKDMFELADQEPHVEGPHIDEESI